jgi:CBS-domain-containing membrane protein
MYRKGIVVSDVLAPAIVSCTINDSLDQVLQKLKRYHILSAPVRDAEDKNYVGRISTRDIVNIVANNPNITLNEKISDIWSSAVGVTSEDEKSFKYGPGGLESIYTFKITTPIEVILETFAKGVHQILLSYSAEGHENILRVVSQSDMIRYMFTEDNFLDKDFKTMKLSSLNCIERPVTTVNLNDKVIDTIRMMAEKNLRAVAVLEENSNKIKTTFSASELKGLTPRLLKQLENITIKEYFRKTYRKPRSPVGITEQETLEEALRRLTLQRVHRLWEINEDKTVTGVLSMTDIFKVLAQNFKFHKTE